MVTSNGVLATARSQDDGSRLPQPLKRTYALYLESDEESDNDGPPQDIEDILTMINCHYPAMGFWQYVEVLKEHGIKYLPTAAHFGERFYEEKIGMPEGAAFTFHSYVCQAHAKEERAKARRKVKGKKKAQPQSEDGGKENTPPCF